MDIILNIIYYVVPFILLLGVLVFVHEFGHFIVARSLGVAVSTFSIGFGKELWSRVDKHGTKWTIAAVPLGGYCQFLGDADASSSTEAANLSELSEEDKKHAFAFQKSWKKLAIVLAGPGFNYLFAIVVIVLMFYNFGRIVYPSVVGEVLVGEAADIAGIKAGDNIISLNGKPTPDFMTLNNEIMLSPEDTVKVAVERPLNFTLQAEEMELPLVDGDKEVKKVLGLFFTNSTEDNSNEPETEPVNLVVVDNVVTDSSADKVGFERGDIIKSINDVEINSSKEIQQYIADHPDEEYTIKVIRPLVFDVTLKNTSYDTGKNVIKRRMLGIKSSTEIVFTETNMSFFKAVEAGLSETWSLTVTTLRSVGQMITGQRGGKEVGGIIRIAEMSGDISKTGGFFSFIYFMALLSVNLGLINLLPIPVLDGGHVVIFVWEMITGRELKAEIKDYIFKFGLFIILGIMVLATWNDVAHLISRWFDK